MVPGYDAADMGKNRNSIDGLRAENDRLKLRLKLLELKLEQEQELHEEWVASMKAMHGAAVETLERIRIEEQHRRAFSEQQLERPSNSGINGAFGR